MTTPMNAADAGRVAEVVAGLTKAQRRLIEVSDYSATAKMLADRHGQMNGHAIGHFARRSDLFQRIGTAEHWVTIWQLTPLGLAVRDAIMAGEK